MNLRWVASGIGLLVSAILAVVMTTVQNYAPSFFAGVVANSKIYVAGTEDFHGGSIFIGPTGVAGVRPAKSGETVTLWGTGFGPTTPTILLSVAGILAP